MNFVSILNWIDYVKETPNYDLQKVINENFDLYEHIEDNNKYKVDNYILSLCKEKLKGSKIEEIFWKNTICFLHNDSFSEDLFNYLMENDMCILMLGHLPLKDEFLWRLVNQVDEAILTLGIRYYTQNEYSSEDFRGFMLKFKNNEWLWRTILNKGTLDVTKEKIFRKMLFNVTDFCEMKVQLIELSIENHLISSKRVNLIKKYYAKNNAQYLRGIAQNLVTPIEILNELAQVKDIRFAK